MVKHANPFPGQREIENRILRARVAMDRDGLDALLLFTGPNLVYFAGPVNALGGRSGSRPWVYLLPRKSTPTLLVQDGPHFLAQAYAYVGDIRPYTPLSRIPLEILLTLLKERNLLQARLGVELGQEMVLDLPFSSFLNLQAALPKAALVDASALLWKLRQIKSVSEIKQIARACQATADAYRLAFRQLRPGMTESQLELNMILNSLQAGGRAPWVLITSCPENYDIIGKGGSERTIKMNNLVWMDSGCSVNGYCSDFSRAGILGNPSREQIEAHAEIHRITAMGVQMLAPGMPVAEIGARCNAAVEALGLPVTSNVSGLAARVGHGIGLQTTELPSLCEEDETILQPGMVVTVEPGIATSNGTFQMEEVVLVTETGRQVLSTAPWEIQLAGN